MTAAFGGRVVATAQFSPNAAADGHGGWIVPGLPRRLFTRDQAITAMVLAERLAAALAVAAVALVAAVISHQHAFELVRS